MSGPIIRTLYKPGEKPRNVHTVDMDAWLKDGWKEGKTIHGQDLWKAEATAKKSKAEIDAEAKLKAVRTENADNKEALAKKIREAIPAKRDEVVKLRSERKDGEASKLEGELVEKEREAEALEREVAELRAGAEAIG